MSRMNLASVKFKSREHVSRKTSILGFYREFDPAKDAVHRLPRIIQFVFIESLILAQDERWRRG